MAIAAFLVVAFAGVWIENVEPEPVQVTYTCTATLMDGTEVPCG